MPEQRIDQWRQTLKSELPDISDAIFDRPKAGLKEHFALAQPAGRLEAPGHQVQRWVVGAEAASRAVWRQ